MKPSARASGVVLYVLLFFGLFLVVLSVDVMVRVVEWRPKFAAPSEYVVLLAGETLRVVLIVCGMAAAWFAVKQGRRSALPWLGLGAGLLTLAFARALTGPLPGPLQEAIAYRLLASGLSQQTVAVVFVRAEWVAWLALPPLLLFAALWPRQLSGADVLGSGAGDRAGALREVAIAGADVGQVARRAAVAVLGRGLLRPAVLWPIAVAGAIAHTVSLLTGGLLTLVLLPTVLLLAAAAVALLITLLRAGAAAAAPGERRLYAWLTRGAAAAAGLIVLGAIAELVPGGALVGVVALYAAPAVLLACTLTGLRGLAPQPADRAASLSAAGP